MRKLVFFSILMEQEIVTSSSWATLELAALFREGVCVGGGGGQGCRKSRRECVVALNENDVRSALLKSKEKTTSACASHPRNPPACQSPG
jgi:hypothetical protein